MTPPTGPGSAIAKTAEALVGAPFRLHGRDPATGLDCVGLVACAMEGAGLSPVAPRGYRLRNISIAAHLDFARRSGLVDADGPLAPGDILLTLAGPAQHHICVALGEQRYVHAHAGLRRVVLHAGSLPWPMIARWRA